MANKKLSPLEHLDALRNQLLVLHKSLLDYQIKIFEATHGRIVTVGHLFELASTHASFTWLRTLSELMVSLDTMIDNKTGLEQKNIKNLSC